FAVYCVLSQITDAVRTASRAKHSALNLSISIQGLSLDEDEDPYNLLDVFIDLSKSDPEKLLISKEEQNSLFEFMDTELTGNEREALKLFIDGYSYSDIAIKLGRTVKSVDSAIQRARAKFESYKKEYIYD
ncbi:MAG: sigma factor-like helix-turn-helix DNA-binding protein, partial [Saccharofermentanales bacterium]